MKHKYKLAYMDMAERFGQTSEAERAKVGALIIKNGSIIAEGCNGTPSGYHTNRCEDDNWETIPEVNHAEINALNKLRRSHNTSVGASMFVTMAPCYRCSLEIVDAGIKEVYYRYDYRKTEGIEYLLSKNVKITKLESGEN